MPPLRQVSEAETASSNESLVEVTVIIEEVTVHEVEKWADDGGRNLD